MLAPPDYKEEILGQFKKLQAGELIENHETKRVRKDGVVIDISLTLSSIKDTSGNIYGVSAIMHDITEQKKAEQLLTVSEYSEKHHQHSARTFNRSGSGFKGGHGQPFLL